VADGVHAAVHAVQPSVAETHLDGVPRQADDVQLRPRDDAVLAQGQRSDGSVRR
jgi:hypothetical protein